MKSKVNLKNIYAYIQGNIRYKLYYSKYRFVRRLIPTHIYDQINCRISTMDKQCFINGSCKLCGCKTTHLQMANKACDKPCYPTMLSVKKWNNIKNSKTVFCKETNKHWVLDKNKFKIVYE